MSNGKDYAVPFGIVKVDPRNISGENEVFPFRKNN